MQTTEPAVCNLSLFGEGIRQFCTIELTGLLERFPSLEFPHIQDYFCLMFVEDARGEITIDNLKIRADQAKTIVIKPRCISKIDLNRLAKGKLICFTEDFFSLRYNSNTLSQFAFLQRDALPFIRLNNEQNAHLDGLITLLEREYSNQKRDSKKVLRSYLNILLVELDRIFSPSGFVLNRSLNLEKIQKYESLIEKHFLVKRLPSQYAALLNVSPNYLNKICKEETGQTAGDLIRKRIVIETQRQLHYTNLSVKEIADKLGFENASYFVTFFKKNAGMTPEQFRKSGIDF
jgi:AraC family transcriptional activator of pobA